MHNNPLCVLNFAPIELELVLSLAPQSHLIEVTLLNAVSGSFDPPVRPPSRLDHFSL